MPPPKRPDGPLTWEEARKHIDYDPETGLMTWAHPGPRRHVGAEVGWITYKNYRIFQLFGKMYGVHRFAFFWMEKTVIPEEMCVDHMNLDRLDNRWSNLRIATMSENQLNTERYGDLRGIMHRGGDAYRIRLNINGERVNVSIRGTLEDAIEMRNRLALVRGGIRGTIS